MLDEQVNELPGFGFADDVAIQHNAVRARVTWKDRPDPHSLQDKTVRIGLRIQGGACCLR